MEIQAPSVAELQKMALKIFDNNDDARRWFELENVELFGAKPNDVMSTDQGRMAVYAILTRLEYGVFA